MTLARSGVDALALLEKGPLEFDLVLLDIMMPKVSGFEVCREIREHFPVYELPVLFLTAKNQQKDLAQAFAAGANDYLTKPCSKEELLARIRTHLELLDKNRNLDRMVKERTRELEFKNLELQETNRELMNLNDLVKAINQEVELKNLLQTMVVQFTSAFPEMERGAFLIWDTHHSQFTTAAVIGWETAQIKRRAFTQQSLHQAFELKGKEFGEFGRAFPSGENPLVDLGFCEGPDPSETLCMIFSIESKVRGYLVLSRQTSMDSIHASTLEKFSHFREHAISALIKVQYLQELQNKNKKILQAQDQLLLREKMASLGILTAGIAHEIKNPLNFINNFSWLSRDLVQELKDEFFRNRTKFTPDNAENIESIFSDLAQNIEIIGEHGKTANHIIQNMMEIAKGESGSFQSTELNSLVDEFVDLAYHGFQVKHEALEIELVKNYDRSIPKLNMVAQSLSRAVVNVMNNAIEALMERLAAEPDHRARIQITTLLKERLLISIRDNGVGLPKRNPNTEDDIAPNTIKKLFDPFYTTKPAQSGNIGLGLSLAYDTIVQEHQGSLELDSDFESYTEVRMYIPVEQRRIVDSHSAPH